MRIDALRRRFAEGDFFDFTRFEINRLALWGGNPISPKIYGNNILALFCNSQNVYLI